MEIETGYIRRFNSLTQSTNLKLLFISMLIVKNQFI